MEDTQLQSKGISALSWVTGCHGAAMSTIQKNAQESPVNCGQSPLSFIV